MDGGYEISSAADDEPVRKLYLLVGQVGYQMELEAYQRIKVPIRARARTGEARTS